MKKEKERKKKEEIRKKKRKCLEQNSKEIYSTLIM